MQLMYYKYNNKDASYPILTGAGRCQSTPVTSCGGGPLTVDAVRRRFNLLRQLD